MVILGTSKRREEKSCFWALSLSRVSTPSPLFIVLFTAWVIAALSKQMLEEYMDKWWQGIYCDFAYII